MAPRAILLLSGGIDSVTAGAMNAKYAHPHDLYALTVDYGQAQKAELEAARDLGQWLGVAFHRVVKFDLSQICRPGGPTIPTLKTLDEIRSEPSAAYIPGRNTFLVSVALAWSDVLSASAIVIGCNRDDGLGFPDCSQAWLDAAQRTIRLGSTSKPDLLAPLIALPKYDVVMAAARLHVPLEKTVSCYYSTDGMACGRCDACVLRREAFLESDVPDPTRYRVEP